MSAQQVSKTQSDVECAGKIAREITDEARSEKRSCPSCAGCGDLSKRGSPHRPATGRTGRPDRVALEFHQPGSQRGAHIAQANAEVEMIRIIGLAVVLISFSKIALAADAPAYVAP